MFLEKYLVSVKFFPSQFASGYLSHIFLILSSGFDYINSYYFIVNFLKKTRQKRIFLLLQRNILSD